MLSVLSVAAIGAGQQAPKGLRTGIIAGRVLDASNQPVADVLVAPLWQTALHNGSTIHPVDVRAGSITNARGEFRIERLLPGSYYLVALPHNVPRNQRVAADGEAYRFGHGITYYPAATRVAEAKPIAVDGTHVAEGTITLTPTHLAQISGVALKSDGQPARGGMLGVAHGDHLFGLDSTAVPIRPDGTFVVVGVPPGTYHLQLHEGQWPPPRDVIPKVSGASVSVTDGDVTRVRVVPIPMVKVTGRVVLSASQQSLKSSEIRISGAPSDWDGNPGPQRGGTVRGDLSFEFRTWPGPGYVRAWVGSEEWTTKAVRLRGVDVSHRDIDFRAGEDVTGLEVELGEPRKR